MYEWEEIKEFSSPFLCSHEHSIEHLKAEAPIDDIWPIVELFPQVFGLLDGRVVGHGQLLERRAGRGQVGDVREVGDQVVVQCQRVEARGQVPLTAVKGSDPVFVQQEHLGKRDKNTFVQSC